MGITRKQWLDRRSAKIAKSHKKNRIRTYCGGRIRTKKSGKITRKTFIAEAPREMSIINNSAGAYQFFLDIVNEVKKNQYGEIFYFDLINIELLTVDVIMYILAIIRNIKSKKILKHIFKGNQPVNKEANNMFEKSGFFKYVKSNNPYLNTVKDNLQITTGKDVNVDIAGEICDFVKRKCIIQTFLMDDLYNLIIELMTNTVQHAYAKEKVLQVNDWYIYADEKDEKIQLVFLDTGVGIPQTIHKKANERFGELFVKDKDDSYYIESALRGEWRSTTAKSYRGLGLPCVVDYSKGKEVEQFTIVSGNSIIRMLHGVVVESVNTNTQLFGTMYYWEILKEVNSIA